MIVIKDLKVGSKLKVVKSLFIFSEDNLEEGVFYSEEEFFGRIDCFIKEGDIWVISDIIEEYDCFELECIEGSMKGESNEGWFEFEEVLKKDCFEII